MLRRKTIVVGEYGTTKYVPLPEHHRWRLGDFLRELSEFYDADGSACDFEVYESVKDYPTIRTWYVFNNPICKFHRDKGRDTLFLTTDLVTSDILDLEIFCDFGFDFLGINDVWYAYLADPDNDPVNATEPE